MKECPPNKIYNEKTGNCVLKTGAIGKKIMKEYKLTNYIKEETKECPPDKILNPKTNKCVLKTGAIGKKIIKEYKLTNFIKEKTKECPPDKILNPKTNKCVLKTSAIGKKILMGSDEIDNKKKKLKKCEIGKIRNPYTNKCIDANGAVAKKLKKEAQKNTNITETNYDKTIKTKKVEPKTKTKTKTETKVTKLVKKLEGDKPKFQLSKLLSKVFTHYPLDHSLDKKAVERFIEASDPSVKNICRKIIDNTDHISFEKLLTRLNSNIKDLIKKVKFNGKKNQDIYCYLGLKITNHLMQKSNYWLYLYISEYIKYKTEGKINVILIDNLDTIKDNNANIMLIDDCIYSGSQMGSTIRSITYKNKMTFNFYFLIPFMSKKGKKYIEENFNANTFLSNNNCKIIFLDHIYFITEINNILTIDEIDKISKFYNGIVSFNNKYLIYFDHKLADVVSTITGFFLGIVPCKKNIKLIIDLKFTYFDRIIVPDKYINNFIVIPIIKNCSNYSNKLNLTSPKCPAPPYKSSFKNFIKKIKINKKPKSLSFEKNRIITNKIKSY